MKLDQKGFALPLILGIALIIIVISGSIVVGTRQKLKTAWGVKNRSFAYVATYSTLNKVIFNLLTSTPTEYGINLQTAVEGEATWWNLYGDPIDLGNGVTISLRDRAGMISPLFDKQLMQSVLTAYLSDPNQAPSLVDTLDDWQDRDDFKRLNGAESWDYRLESLAYEPRNFYIQTLEELKLLKDVSSESYDQIKDDLIYWGGGHKNYLTMSRKTLQGLLGNDDLVENLIEMRKLGQLNSTDFEAMTGLITSETYLPMPSGWIKVEITAKHEDTVDHLETVISTQQYIDKPFLVTEWKR